jgi:hypothetical protein
VFNQAGKTDRDKHARRVVRWLKTTQAKEVGRINLRREALAQSVDAMETDRVISRLEEAGVLRLASSVTGPKGGGTKRRWTVNPALGR